MGWVGIMGKKRKKERKSEFFFFFFDLDLQKKKKNENEKNFSPSLSLLSYRKHHRLRPAVRLTRDSGHVREVRPVLPAVEPVCPRVAHLDAALARVRWLGAVACRDRAKPVGGDGDEDPARGRVGAPGPLRALGRERLEGAVFVDDAHLGLPRRGRGPGFAGRAAGLGDADREHERGVDARVLGEAVGEVGAAGRARALALLGPLGEAAETEVVLAGGLRGSRVRWRREDS